MKGLMFKEELFRAVVAGKKTQTRRIVENKIVQFGDNGIQNGELIGKGITDFTTFELPSGDIIGLYPRYRTGEVVYLKEPWAWAGDTNVVLHKYSYPGCVPVHFENIPPIKEMKWENKMFMPEDKARYFIKITRVRVERLNAISEPDAKAEGVDPDTWTEGIDGYRFRHPYLKLWETINGKDSWKLNPWVWIYEFELTEKP